MVARTELARPCHNRKFDERTLQATLPFFTHAILLDQVFTHCPRFSIVAAYRNLGRVSILMWLIIRKDQLTIVGLVSLYLINYLILCGLIKQHFLVFFNLGFGLNRLVDSYVLYTCLSFCLYFNL